MRLYALCDQDMLDEKGISLDAFVAKAKSRNAEVLQYRNKNAPLDVLKKNLIALRKIFDGFLIINDAYELIEFCDGVHLGQEDLLSIDKDITKAVKIVRSVIGEDKILGISTHNEQEVLLANTLDINYVGLGAYRNTQTKKDIAGVLGESIETIAAKSKHLVGAIGGVKLSDNFQNITYHVIGSGLVE